MRVKRQRVFIQSFFCERSEPTRPTNLQILALVIIKTILKIQERVDYENINISKGFQIFFSSKMKKNSKSSHETKKKIKFNFLIFRISKMWLEEAPIQKLDLTAFLKPEERESSTL